MEVDVNIQQCSEHTKFPISDRSWVNWFSIWLETMQYELPPALGYELNIRLTDDAEIQVLNYEYRDRDRPTDVLAFASLEVDFPQPEELLQFHLLYLGDIVISVETANRQARERGHSLFWELAWLATHGLLHLLGWDHPDDDRLARMLKQQELLLQTAGIVTESAIGTSTIQIRIEDGDKPTARCANASE